MKVLRFLLYPFALLYDLGSRIRNYLYDIGHKPSFRFDAAVISVGNLNVGGSGKTPLIEYLVDLLHENFQIATLSRGYKRTTDGFRQAGESDTARTIGDEPLQLYKKFGDKIKVTVGEDRAFAIPHILQELPETSVILLDDAFQHRSVRPRLSILVTECLRPFYADYVLPFGRLRESRGGAGRADVIVVTKCDSKLSAGDRQTVAASIRRYAGDKPVFFSSIQYDEPRPMTQNTQLKGKVVLVTGIANAEPFERYCRSRFEVLRHFEFPDHHRYSPLDLQEIKGFCERQQEMPSLLTTEKDKVKLEAPEFRQFVDDCPWLYVPIRHAFIEDGLKFDELVLAAAAR